MAMESNLGTGTPMAQLASFSIRLLPGALTVSQAHRLASQQPDNLCGPICNLQTGFLWGARLALADALAYLKGENIDPRKIDWDIGHYLTLAGTVNQIGDSALFVMAVFPVASVNDGFLAKFSR